LRRRQQSSSKLSSFTGRSNMNKPELPPLPIANVPENIKEALDAWASSFAIEYAMWYTQDLRKGLAIEHVLRSLQTRQDQVDIAENQLQQLQPHKD
jgi:nuclear transport factor 2 (NTF2) superfamily protein